MTEYYPLKRPTTERAGILRISGVIMKELVPEIDFEQCDTQRYLREAGAFEALHKALMLPESCVIHFIWAEVMGRVWALLVESPLFPIAVPEGAEWPRFEATYQSRNGATSLYKLSLGGELVWCNEQGVSRD